MRTTFSPSTLATEKAHMDKGYKVYSRSSTMELLTSGHFRRRSGNEQHKGELVSHEVHLQLAVAMHVRVRTLPDAVQARR